MVASKLIIQRLIIIAKVIIILEIKLKKETKTPSIRYANSKFKTLEI